MARGNWCTCHADACGRWSRRPPSQRCLTGKEHIVLWLTSIRRARSARRLRCEVRNKTADLTLESVPIPYSRVSSNTSALPTASEAADNDQYRAVQEALRSRER